MAERKSSSKELAPDATQRYSKMAAGTLTLAISSAMIGSLHAEEVSLDTLLIEDSQIAADANPYAEPGAPYKAKRTSDTRRVRDIADTPQTMTVLTKESIEDFCTTSPINLEKTIK